MDHFRKGYGSDLEALEDTFDLWSLYDEPHREEVLKARKFADFLGSPSTSEVTLIARTAYASGEIYADGPGEGEVRYRLPVRPSPQDYKTIKDALDLANRRGKLRKG